MQSFRARRLKAGSAGMTWRELHRHQLQRFIHGTQHAIELMSALDDQTCRRNHAVGTLPARQPRIFLDAIERHFGGATEDGKHRAVFEKINRVIAPLSGCDHAAIEAENAVELAAAEGDLAGSSTAFSADRKST